MAVQHRCWPSIQCRPGSAVRAARVLAVVCLLAVRTRVGGSAPRGGGGAEDGAEGDAEGSDGRPAVVVKLANALHRSTEYGQYDDEFLKSNIAEVRAGYYQVYYSPRVFTERPEQVTITLAVEVTGYDMGARFKGFAPDAARPCVRVQMPEDDQYPFGNGVGDAEFCGQRSFSFNWYGKKNLHEPMLFHATLYDRDSAVVADSETLAVEYVELPSWRPSPFESPLARLQGDSAPESKPGLGAGQGAYGDRAAVTFLADEADVDGFLARLDNWRENLGNSCAPPASARAHDTARCSRSADAGGGGDDRHGGDKGSDGGRASGTASSGDGGRWTLHVFVAVEALHAHQLAQRDGASSSSMLHTASQLLPFQLHVVAFPPLSSQPSAAPASPASGLPMLLPLPPRAIRPHASWSGRRRLLRFHLYSDRMLRHEALLSVEHVLVLDASLRFTRPLSWLGLDALATGLGANGAGQSPAPPLVATSYGVLDRAEGTAREAEGGHVVVEPLHCNRGLVQRSLDVWSTRGEGGEEQGWGEDMRDGTQGSSFGANGQDARRCERGRADALIANLYCPGEREEHRNRTVGRCEGGGWGVWNRVAHLGKAFYFRRSVIDNECFRSFVREIDAAEGLATRLWTVEGVLSIWALLTVEVGRWRDMSAVVGHLLPDAPSSEDEIISRFPLNRELRAVNDVFREPLHSLELVDVALNHYVAPMFKTPEPLLNHTCDHLSPQLWPECIPRVLQQHTIEEFLDKHHYKAESAHASGYWQLHDFLIQHSGSDMQRHADGEDGTDSVSSLVQRARETSGAGTSVRGGKWDKAGGLNALRPVISKSYIAKIVGAFVDGNGVHPAAFGTVFDHTRMFLPQPYVKDACTHYLSRHHVRIRHIHRLIVGNNVVYPTSYGHFLHEILPRIIWMAQKVPEEVPILMVLTQQIREIMDVLYRNGVPVPPERLIAWEDDMVVYGSSDIEQTTEGDTSGQSAHRNRCLPYGSIRPLTVVAVDELYAYGEWPYNNVSNPNSGGQNSYHPRQLLQAARQAFVGRMRVPEEERRTLVLIKRPGSGWGRGLGNHDEVVAGIEALPPFASSRLVVHIFEGEGSMREQIAVFAGARAVLGPHGAGFSNLLFSAPGTRVVELGWQGDGGPERRQDGRQGLWLSDIYFSLAQALDLEYWLVLAYEGDQVTPLFVHVEHVLATLADL